MNYHLNSLSADVIRVYVIREKRLPLASRGILTKTVPYQATPIDPKGPVPQLLGPSQEDLVLAFSPMIKSLLHHCNVSQ